VRLADYRREHPSPHTTEFLQYIPKESEEEKADYAELAEGARLYEFKLNTMVERYASKP
jgi:hypothetical protein